MMAIRMPDTAAFKIKYNMLKSALPAAETQTGTASCSYRQIHL
jgi:hypothetical protein